MPPRRRLILSFLVVWTVAMAAWLFLYQGEEVTCGPEIYRNCQIGLKVTTGLGAPGIVLLWSLGVVALGLTWVTSARRGRAATRRATPPDGTSASGVAATGDDLARALATNARDAAMLAPVDDQSFRESEEYERLQPYMDGDGLLAGYRIEGLLSRDPWRHVIYEASAPGGQRVALKLFQLRSRDRGRARRRFRRAIRTRASIEHPHLLPVYDWGAFNQHRYVAMGLCKAPTLSELLRLGRIRTESWLRLLAQVADALEAGHERGLVHRELAPANVIVARLGGGHALLDDFGVGNQDSPAGILDLGEPVFYASPEKLKDQPLTPASNVYSLACIMVECLTGSPPYSSEVPGMIAYTHAAAPPPRISDLRPELPAALDDLVAVAMAKDPKDRPASPRWVVEAAAASLHLEGATRAPYGPDQGRKPELSSANGDSGDRALPSAAGSGGEPAGPPPRGALAPPWARRIAVLALAIGTTVAGLVGLTLVRSADDRGQATRDPARVPAERAERDRAAALRATGVALEQLEFRRGRARITLARADTRQRQAAAARELAQAYRAAARGVPTGFPDIARLASALNETGRAYRRLTAAARQGSRRRYALAARAVRGRERDLQGVIIRLNRARR